MYTYVLLKARPVAPWFRNTNPQNFFENLLYVKICWPHALDIPNKYCTASQIRVEAVCVSSEKCFNSAGVHVGKVHTKVFL